MASPAMIAKRKRPRVSCCHRHVHDDFFIYLAKSRSQAEARFRAFRARWRREMTLSSVVELGRSKPWLRCGG